MSGGLAARGLARAYDAGRRALAEQERQLQFWVHKVSLRPVLVPMAVAVVKLGFTAESIREMRDAGELRWVWDIGLGGRKIENLRFWFGELDRLDMGDNSARYQQPGPVIQAVVGHPEAAELGSRTVTETLFITRNTLQGLHLTGELTGRLDRHVRRTDRASLVAFLERRLIV